MKKHSSILLLVLLSLSFKDSNTFANQSGQKWFHSWASALKAASYNKKPIFVDVYANWCHYCHILKKEVFPAIQIKKLFRQFNLVRIDADKRQAFTKKFPADSLPKLFFFDKNGNLLRLHDGFISVGNLREKLLKTLAEKNLENNLVAKNTFSSNFRLASLYYSSKKNAKALSYFQKSVNKGTSINPEYKSALFNLAVLQTKQEYFPQSIKNWNSYLKLAEENEEGFLQARFYRGLAYFKIDEYNKAREDMIYASQNLSDSNIRHYAYSILEEIKNARD